MAKKVSRRQIADYVATQLTTGASVETVFAQLAGHLIETRRTKEVELIVRDVEVALAKKGFVNTLVTSAHPLSAELQKAIEQFVATETGAAHVTLSSEIDESVIGGVKIRTPGRALDRTIHHQLTTLRTQHRKA